MTDEREFTITLTACEVHALRIAMRGYYDLIPLTKPDALAAKEFCLHMINRLQVECMDVV